MSNEVQTQTQSSDSSAQSQTTATSTNATATNVSSNAVAEAVVGAAVGAAVIEAAVIEAANNSTADDSKDKSKNGIGNSNNNISNTSDNSANNNNNNNTGDNPNGPNGVEPVTIHVYSALIDPPTNIPLPYTTALPLSSPFSVALTPDLDLKANSKNPLADDDLLDKFGGNVIRGDDSGQGSSSPICDDPDLTPDLDFSVKEETLAESSLPWRRQTSLPPVPSSLSLSLPDDENPLMSEAPSWAKNLDYFHMTESGSPYHSPQHTLQANTPASPVRPVFDIFPPSSPSPEEEEVPAPVPNIPNIPPPWSLKDEDSGHVEEEPIRSHSSQTRQAAGDKASCLLVSSHDLVPPSHHSCIELSNHAVDGGNLRRVNSVASSPVHFQLMDKPDAFAMNMIESELIGVESDYQHSMRDRVSKWLASSPSSANQVDALPVEGLSPSKRGSPSLEAGKILESLRLKKEEWSQHKEESGGTDADVESEDEVLDTRL